MTAQINILNKDRTDSVYIYRLSLIQYTIKAPGTISFNTLTAMGNATYELLFFKFYIWNFKMPINNFCEISHREHAHSKQFGRKRIKTVGWVEFWNFRSHGVSC